MRRRTPKRSLWFWMTSRRGLARHSRAVHFCNATACCGVPNCGLSTLMLSTAHLQPWGLYRVPTHGAVVESGSLALQFNRSNSPPSPADRRARSGEALKYCSRMTSSQLIEVSRGADQGRLQLKLSSLKILLCERRAPVENTRKQERLKLTRCGTVHRRAPV
jgi:hypothetical protein